MEALLYVDEPDTIVVDPEEDDMPQIHGDDGYWHRQTPDQKRFACGVLIDLRLRQSVRASSYKGPLCPQCFAPYELSVSREIERERLAKIAAGSQPIPTLRKDK